MQLRPVADENDLPCHTAFAEHLVRISCLGKWKSMRYERLDLLLLKEVKQSHQILAKQGWTKPFEPLDAVGHYPSPAWEKPAASNVQPEDADFTEAMATT